MQAQRGEWTRANPRAWAGFAFVLLASGALYLFAGSIADTIAPVQEEATPDEVRSSVRLTFLLIGALLFIQAAIFAYLGFRQISIARAAADTGRFPPEGVRLMFPMRVVSDGRLGQLVFYYRFLGACNLVVALASLWGASRSAL